MVPSGFVSRSCKSITQLDRHRGLKTLSTLVGPLMSFGLVLSLVSVVGCAIVMAIGHQGLLLCLVAALLIGDSDVLMR